MLFIYWLLTHRYTKRIHPEDALPFVKPHRTLTVLHVCDVEDRRVAVRIPKAITRGAQGIAERPGGTRVVDRLVALGDHGVVFEHNADVCVVSERTERYYTALGIGKIIVAHGVVGAVMLEIAACLAIGHNVALDPDIGRALIGIDAVAAVVRAGYIMDAVPLDQRSPLLAEKVDGRHVGKQADTDVMNVIFAYDITEGRAFGIPPYPAHRDPRIIGIRDLVFADFVVGGMAYENAAGGGVSLADVVDVVANDRAM